MEDLGMANSILMDDGFLRQTADEFRWVGTVWCPEERSGQTRWRGRNTPIYHCFQNNHFLNSGALVLWGSYGDCWRDSHILCLCNLEAKTGQWKKQPNGQKLLGLGETWQHFSNVFEIQAKKEVHAWTFWAFFLGFSQKFDGMVSNGYETDLITASDLGKRQTMSFRCCAACIAASIALRTTFTCSIWRSWALSQTCEHFKCSFKSFSTFQGSKR